MNQTKGIGLFKKGKQNSVINNSSRISENSSKMRYDSQIQSSYKKQNLANQMGAVDEGSWMGNSSTPQKNFVKI